LELEDIDNQLAQVQQALHQKRSTPADTRSPYVGLLTFQEDDSTFFFGRDALIGELLDKVERSSFLAVLGSSGSGKRSVVRAGLVPALKRGALPGSDQWHYLPPLKPSANPINTLAAILAAAHEGRLGDITAIRKALLQDDDALLLMAEGLLTGRDTARLVVVVNQAEELWTLAPSDTTAQAAFIQRLLTAARSPDRRVLIILTMRADFLHRAIEHHDLAHWMGEHDVMVSPQLPDELRTAITRPAELVGGGFEHGLVDALVEQTIGRPGALPLLEYTLLELWKTRTSDGTMTWDTFKSLGGVEGGLARRADTILTKKYTLDQQTELRALLLRLVQPGEGASDTRRRVRMHDLVAVGGTVEEVRTLLKPLADERLITTGYDPASQEETVEVLHEALIRAWPTFGSWISAARTDLRFQIQLEEATKEWVANNEDADFLWSGLRLANAEAWLNRVRPRLNMNDQRFLDASRAQRLAEIEAREAAQQHELRLARRNLFISLGALAGTVIAVVVIGWLWISTSMAEQRAFGQLLVAKGQSVYDDNPLLGVRLAIEGLAWLPQNDPARADLIRITVQLAREGRLQKLASDGSEIFASPNGTTFVLDRADKPAELRLADGSIVTPLTDIVSTVSFSPDSTLFVVRYTGKPAELWRADGTIVTLLSGDVTDVSFSPDSTLFVVAYFGKPYELWRADGTIITSLADNTYHVNFSFATVQKICSPLAGWQRGWLVSES
jgi:hypothetical protein